MRALVAGWFSFEGMGATAGDLLSRDVVCRWLADAGCPYDVAVASPFTDGIDWRAADPAAYTHAIFVCGPFGNGEPVTGFLERFSSCELVGVNLTMLDTLDTWNPFDLLIERDSSRRSLPDLVLAADAERVPVLGLVTIHEQPEYGERDRHLRANAALKRLVTAREAAVVVIDTRLDEQNLGGLRTPGEIASLIAAMDAVATTRLHGMVLAIAAGVPAIAVDPVRGGAKISRQADALGWPIVFTVEDLNESEMSAALDFCLTSEAREMALACRLKARVALKDASSEFASFFGRPPEAS